jgi:hypothetical protein
MKKIIWLRVKGGLGNQMFQYAMWMRLVERFPDADVRLEVSRLKKGNRRLDLKRLFHGLEICELSWWADRLAKYASRWNIHALSRLGLHPTLLLEKEGLDFESISANIEQVGDAVLEGYWQSTELHEPALSRLASRINAIPLRGTELNEMSALAEHAIAVHVRLDDYLLPQNQLVFQQLSTKYFIQSILKLASENEQPCIVVFSDSPNEVFKVHPELKQFEWKLAADFCQNHIDEFLWLKDFRRIVTSNSTFSYWASSIASELGLERRTLPTRYFRSDSRNEEYLAGRRFLLRDDMAFIGV